MIAVELSLRQLLDAVKRLSPNDKLKLNEAIWNDSSVIPLEHKELVRKRVHSAKETPSLLIDWEEAVKKLND
ncbi:hypothetical protein [Pedobacter deserti]|uniref:hypothetical protein n=1 Tax=Pedobacter deserti TaxID=2817382 RepID=UPI0021097085|nr:hypothetical protein [Pedobacter sp. SYSU D00382]